MDIIQFIDGVRKLIQYLTLDRPDESESQRIMKLTKVLKSIPSDLEDICSKQGISPFKCSETAFNPGRQRILRKIFMATAEQDKTVAEACAQAMYGMVRSSGPNWYRCTFTKRQKME